LDGTHRGQQHLNDPTGFLLHYPEQDPGVVLIEHDEDEDYADQRGGLAGVLAGTLLSLLNALYWQRLAVLSVSVCAGESWAAWNASAIAKVLGNRTNQLGARRIVSTCQRTLHQQLTTVHDRGVDSTRMEAGFGILDAGFGHEATVTSALLAELVTVARRDDESVPTMPTSWGFALPL